MRWHIGVFLAPALLVYTAIMILPLIDTLRLSLLHTVDGAAERFVGLANFKTLFGRPALGARLLERAGQQLLIFFVDPYAGAEPDRYRAGGAAVDAASCASRAFYRTAIFMPTLLSFVIVGFIWKLILSPIWGVVAVPDRASSA